MFAKAAEVHMVVNGNQKMKILQNFQESLTLEEFINSSHSGKVFERIEGDEKSMKNYEYNPADHKFETLGEFKFYLSCGANVGFKYNGIYYGI